MARPSPHKSLLIVDYNHHAVGIWYSLRALVLQVLPVVSVVPVVGSLVTRQCNYH